MGHPMAHTIELDDHDSRWILDALRWAIEDSNDAGRRRVGNHLEKAESNIKDQLPPYSELEP